MGEELGGEVKSVLYSPCEDTHPRVARDVSEGPQKGSIRSSWGNVVCGMDRTQQQRADCVQDHTHTQISVTCNNLHHTPHHTPHTAHTPYIHTLLHFLFSVCLLFKWFAVTVLLHHHLVVLLHKLDLKTSTGKWVWWGEGPVHEQLLVDNGLRGRGVARGVARVWQGVGKGSGKGVVQ